MDRPIVTEVTRSINDSSFSMDELFYRYFGFMPKLFFQAGTTDLYDRPVIAAASSSEDDDEQENPNKGPDELDVAIGKLKEFLAENNLGTDTEICKYCSFQNNYFAGFIMLKDHKIILNVRVVPGRRETLTSLAIMGLNEDKAWATLLTLAKKYIQVPPPRQDHIHIISMSDGEFYLKSIPISNKKQQEFSYDFYNDNFQPISERVIKALSSDDESGLVLFHGNPGTGKTSYLKFLLHTITKKKLIYLPPDLIQSLSAPSFIPFLISEASNSILLIEDAENVLKHREAGGDQAVSNILNVSDGILGDVLRLKVVCTFNSKLEEIDEALLRPGRLIAEYRFHKLTPNKTAALMKKLHGDDAVPSKAEMSLAEIFNFDKMPDKTKITKTGIGFAPVSQDD